MQSTIKSFRYDINGLRAIAIIGVLLFHYKLTAFEGGFAGVDVFFVISGYLMSRVVIGQIARDRFTYNDYLERRLHRIVPALLTLIIVITALCFFLYLPVDYKTTLNNAGASILFVSNIFYWVNTPSYFDASTDSNMFLHTWSLSVEWQFYLIYPFVLLLLTRMFKKMRTFKMVFIAITVLTFIASVIVTHYNASASFYLLPTRSWEMLLGGIAFFAEGSIKGILRQRFLAIAGYLVIILSFLTLKESMQWPGIYTLLPVMGTFCIIIANYNNFTVIRHRGFQFIGKISYSLYLWHWPVYVIAQYYGLGTGAVAVVGYCLLSVGLGYLSYKYIEPLQFTGKKKILSGMVALFAAVFALGYFNVNQMLYSKKTLAIAGYAPETNPFFAQFRKDTCFVEGMKKYKEEACLCFAPGKKNILLIGDSHLAQLSQSLREDYGDSINFLQATAPATLPTVKSYYNKKNNNRQLMDYTFFDFIPKNADKIDGVIISGNWAGQRIVGNDSVLFGIKEVIAYLETYDIETVVIGQTERYTVPYPVVAARSDRYDTENNEFYLDDYTQDLDDFLNANLKGVYIDVINEEEFPPLSDEGEPYMRDKDHMTKYGADLLVARLKDDKVWEDFIEGM
jgi:peptidoglycan/LPS O-acetylase OafA/YrhL